MATLELDHLTKQYKRITAVDDLSLTVEDGEMLALLGESGCGKTTTLRMIAGFETPTSGRVLVDGEELGPNVPPYKRNIGIFFQNYALFPHMTVYENVAFGLRMHKVPDDECRERVADALRMVRLSGLDGEHPRRLSGGQQQRVALARALVTRPRILLLDEPLSNLDAKLRTEMQLEIKRIQQELGITTIIVTHHQEEAVSLAHRVAVMRRGQIQQLGAPAEVFDHPSSVFVADFMGFQTFLHGTLMDARDGRRMVLCGDSEVMVEEAACKGMGKGKGAPVVLSLRSEAMTVEPAGAGAGTDAGTNTYVGTVDHSTYRGHTTRLEVSGAFAARLFPSVPGHRDLPDGARVLVGLPVEDIRVFADTPEDPVPQD